MFPCFASAAPASDASSLTTTLIGAIAGIAGSAVVWLLKEVSDRMSAKRLFDHRVRLEKEHQVYSDLWERLFELRRAVGQVIQPVSSTNVVRHDKDTLELFNNYLLAVLRGEPFMSASVFEPARQIETIARRIISNIGTQLNLDEDCAKMPISDFIERRKDERRCLDKDNRAAFKQIEGLCQSVVNAIRLRVSP